MSSAYDVALLSLHRAPFGAFVAERKRLAAELKKSGDPGGATLLAKRVRPPISVWVVNQLYAREREAFDTLFQAAERLRAGDATEPATLAHREALATLRARASALLVDAGKKASEALLRRVTTTLSALAAAGGFAPDPPGALLADRDPPGFELAGLSGPVLTPRPEPKARGNSAAETGTEQQGERQRQEAEQRQKEGERARRRAERERIERRLRLARDELEARSNELSELRRQLSAAETVAAGVRTTVQELEVELAKLAALDL